MVNCFIFTFSALGKLLTPCNVAQCGLNFINQLLQNYMVLVTKCFKNMSLATVYIILPSANWLTSTWQLMVGMP